MTPKPLPPWYVTAPVLFVAGTVLIPVVYLIIRAFEADAGIISELVFRRRNLELLGNTFILALGVLVLATLIAFPLAWVTVRTNLKFRNVFTLLSVLPLAIPGYILAYAILSLGGANGSIFLLTGIEVPRLSGYTGALIAITLYTYPYLYLNLRSGLLGLDSSLEEAARSLGYTTPRIFLHVVLPQLKPAWLAGSLIIGLYVLGDFGAVSLMRFETFSYALFLQYAASYDRLYAAWLALMMLSITGTILFTEYRLLKGITLHRSGSGTARSVRISKLRGFAFPVYAGLVLLTLLSLVIPVSTIVYWMMSARDTWIASGLTRALLSSLSASIPAAFTACALAVPLAYVSVRYPSRWSKLFERIAWFGFATPPLALALAYVFFSLQAVPFLYQTMAVLILAYSIHFMAEALGPIRSALYQAPPRLEEAARSLGMPAWKAFLKSTFPLLRNGTIAGGAFVFLSCMKELPITFLLSPIGFETLALNVWSFSNEAMFANAAPFALTILVFSSVFVGILFSKEWIK